MSGKLPRLRALRPRPQQQQKNEGATQGTDVVGNKLEEEKTEMKMMTGESEVAIERRSAEGSYGFSESVHHGTGDGDGDDDDDDDDEDEEDNEDDEDDDEASSNVKTEAAEIKLTETVHNYECKACKPPRILNNVKAYLEHLKKEHKRKDAHRDDTDGNRCPMCSYVALSLRDMENHQRVHHLKRRFFRCAKCSYVTHVRARYTKHVKYHSMPMIKCDSCDFRTPYKWNLDRHTRNHGGGGAFQCRACNFTADIRQSLTVHETNHHEPPVGQASRKSNTPFERKPRNSPKRYNQVGASDFRESITLAETTSISPADLYISSNVDQVMNAIEEKKNAIASAECIALKCEEKGCQFITAWDSEMQRHLAECHAPGTSSKSRKPLPMLIPLSPVNSKSSNSSSNGSTTTLLKVPRVRVRPELAQIARDTEIAKLYGSKEVISLKKDAGSTAADLFEKKNASFFDKLKEKLTSSAAINNGMQEMAMSTVNDLKCWCTFKANSLEELARHKRTHHTALSVSVDVTPRIEGTSSGGGSRPDKVTNCGSEFRVASYRGEYAFPSQIDWDVNVGGLNSSTSSVEGASTHPSGRRVFKCPHCPFWASTASRFHVHIVGHLNRKPFECSLCAYRSNWRWDITKHIKLKAAKDPVHMTARVLMTDETGRRNYSKYNKYLAQVEQQSWDDQSMEERSLEEIHSEEPPTKLLIMSNKEYMQTSGLTSGSVSVLTSPNSNHGETTLNVPLRPPPPLKAAARGRGQSLLKSKPMVQAVPASGSAAASTVDENKRTLWKCKRCNYRDSNKETVLLHVKSHYESIGQGLNEARNGFPCGECPFSATDAASLSIHKMHHRPNLEAIFKCYLCPYYVSTKAELLDHARLHGEELAVVHQQSMDYHHSSISKIKMSRISASENGVTDAKDDRSLEQVIHITSGNDASSGSSQEQKSIGGGSTAPPPPLLLDTRALPEPPLVWVSRPDGTLAKMLKCRHCPYVSGRRAEVVDHETMHIDSPNHQGSVIACTDCSFTCSRREAMIAHSEMHAGSLGTVHCLVDETRADSQQLNDLTALLGLNHPPTLGSEPDLRDSRLVHCCGKCPARFLCEKELRIHLRYHSTELAYSCQWCSYAARQPAHLLAHQKAHSTEYQERTKYLLSLYGHSQRYPPPTTACVETANDQDRDEAGNPGIAWIVVEMTEAAVSRSLNGSLLSSNSMQKIPAGSQVFTCAKCPARYFKLDALEYHMTLHGSNNRFKCSECDYSSKTAQNLVKHQVVHRRHNETKDPAMPSHLQQQQQQQHHHHQQQQKHQQQQQPPLPPPPPPPPPDPQFGVFMRGNPNFVYPGYLRNGRLKEKRYKCHKCPSAFEKREQYRVHLTLHGAKQRYRCDTCDYSVKYYANYIQHLKKHQANAEAQASRRQFEEETINVDSVDGIADNGNNGTTTPMPTLSLSLSSSSSSSPSSSSSSSSSFSISRSSKTLKSSATVNLNSASSTATTTTAVSSSITASAINNGPMSPTSGSINCAATSLQASNQDKQSLMVMRKKGILSASVEPDVETLRCQSCPFSSTDKETMDAHKRRHGIERMTPSCPHCDYIPRKDENVGEHVRLHFTRLYKPESYLIIELLTLTMKRLSSNGKEEKPKQTAELLFKECPDGRFFPLADAKSLSLGTSNSVNNFREKVIVDPNTGEAKHHLAV